MELHDKKTKVLGVLVSSLLLVAAACSHASTQNATSITNATPNTTMTHIALQELLGNKNVEWMEKVSDEQYGIQKSTP